MAHHHDNKTFNVKNVPVYKEGGVVTTYQDDHEMTEAEVCSRLSTALHVRDSITGAIQSMRRLLGYADNDNTPQARIERSMDSMSETGWAFGEIIADVMAQQDLASASEATDEQWASYLEEWMPS